ncbi:hypothetical protein GCM10010399_93880 [Dactylosporangium fulvum]|uniref:Uncharacterized protein n=1 Tax=Dactylosporangium fulvum TaxID=53359 RepID=A0ABY5VQJ4_9ACTN|nr:hypothetical protein [Dactylosporangium fulvum]UWP79081.1 hypothetical protein Dfulv_28375 [Dactylosporangium fulvum]
MSGTTTTASTAGPRANARLAGYAAVAGGVASAVAGAIQAVRTDDGNPIVGTSEHVLLALTAAALVLWVPGYLALGRASGKLGRTGGVVAVAGAVLLAFGMTSTNLHDEDYSWFPIVAAPANLAWLVGSILLAVATFRTRTLPRPLALALPLVWLTFIILSQLGGNLVAGVIWAVIGWVLTTGDRQGPAGTASGARLDRATDTLLP